MPVDGKSLAVLIPAYAAASTIESVVGAVPDYVDWIIIVDDASEDDLAQVVENINDQRRILLSHARNQGVGGARATGFRKALELKADLVAKVDADGQMDPKYLNRFARAITVHGCDYVKANRFGHLNALNRMPSTRFVGSLGLTVLTKIASGYWNVFDPQNGYIMIRRNMLLRLNLDSIDKSYFFENSMLISLNILRARVGEIYIPAQYGDESSSMNIFRVLTTFPFKLFNGMMYRIFQKYVFRSVSPVALLLFFGLLTRGWGGLWGGWAWYESLSTGVPATTGTVILALLPLLMGWAALLQALILDVQDAGPCLLFEYDDEELNDPEDLGEGE